MAKKTSARKGSENVRLIAFLIVCLMLLQVAPITGADEQVSGRAEVMDPNLREAVEDRYTDEVFEVIMTFDHRPTKNDYRMVRDLDVDIVQKFTVIDGAFIRADRTEVMELSRLPGIKRLTLNIELQYELYETTKVIKTTEAWTRLLVDRYGETIRDAQGDPTYMKGQGVGIAVVDTGVDAGHPDFDYGSKTPINLKRIGAGQWQEEENADTSSGHGTHCAGIATGNGDAAGGRMAGVAPDATLIGLGVGDGLSIYYGLEAIEWVYQNTRPNANEYNIRVVSCSWGSAGNEYDPEGPITDAVQRLAWENNVVTIFAAGNAGGDGSTIETNPYSNIPVAIGVAAINRDGQNMAEFSSRGDKTKKETWPDITAPGGIIWAAAGRHTAIDYSQRASDQDVYYMEISGTSMATPHIAGVAGLLFQACPSMDMTYIHDDFSGSTNDSWYSNDMTKIHECELIMEITATYLTSGEGIPGNGSMGAFNKPHDWVQGYGLVNVEHAVGLALTLQEMRTRDMDHDGKMDLMDIDVWDALVEYQKAMQTNFTTGYTDTLFSSWTGDWGNMRDRTITGAFYDTEQSHYAFIPNGTEQVRIEFIFQQLNLQRNTAADLELQGDTDGDGNSDITPSTSIEGTKEYIVDVDPSMVGHEWEFWVDGTAWGYDPLDEFPEPIVPWWVHIVAVMDESSHPVFEYTENRSDLAQWDFGLPSNDYDGNGSVTMLRTKYNMELVEDKVTIINKVDEGEDTPWGLIILLLIILLVVGLIIGRTLGAKKNEAAVVEPVEVVEDTPPTATPAQEPPEGG